MTKDPKLPLALELVTASRQGDQVAYVEYVNGRLDEELHDTDDAYHLIALLASIAGMSITAWAEDTGREPAEVLQLIALDAALE